jgi:hypothetical protein
MKKQSVKLRRETLDNFGDMLANSAKRIGDVQSLDWAASVGERYRNHDLRMHVYTVGVGSLSKYCAIFEYFPLSPPENEFSTVKVVPGADHRPSYPPGSHNLNEPVLIRVVEFFEPIEGVVKTATPSLVWLQPLNECLMFISKTLNHLAPITPSFDEFAFAAYWKFKLLGQSLMKGNRCALDQKDRELGEACNCVGFQQRQLMNQSIEGRTEIVGDVSDADSPIKGWSGAIYAEAVAAISSLRIQLRPDNLVIGFERVGVPIQFESVDFAFCTPYLEARAIERMHLLCPSIEREI